MNDEYEIQKLLYLCAERIDRGDGCGMAELFSHARIKLTLESDEVYGSEPMAKLYEQIIILHDDGTARTHHVITNPIIDIAADGWSATCRSYYTVVQQTAAVPLQVVAGGRYHDKFEKVDGSWRFAERRYLMDFTGNVKDHVRMNF